MVACQGTPVVGQTPETADDPQSETAIAVSRTTDGADTIVVTFNDDTDNVENGFIEYTQSTRTVYPGASLMGWSISTNGGTSFAYGGKVIIPPALEAAGWQVLWGDPAVTEVPGTSRVYFGNLAISDRTLPASGAYTGSVVPYVDGACIAESLDGGLSFDLVQCITQNTCHNCLLCSGSVTNSNDQPCVSDSSCPSDFPVCRGDFYDGGSMAASPSGEVYYAVHDVHAGRPHVWRKAGPGAPFERLPDPFAGSSFVVHPRLRYDAARDRLYIAQQYLRENCGPECNAGVQITYYEDGVWGPVRDPVFPLELPVVPTVMYTQGSARGGNQFSFDVGETVLRLAMPVRFEPEDETVAFVAVFDCDPDLTGALACFLRSTLSTAGVGYRYNPLVRHRRWVTPTDAGDRWAIAMLTADASLDAVRMTKVIIDAEPPPSVLPAFTEIAPHASCPSLGTNYWGDNDDLQPFGFDTFGRPLFVTAFTESYAGCTVQQAFTSESVHVRATFVP